MTRLLAASLAVMTMLMPPFVVAVAPASAQLVGPNIAPSSPPPPPPPPPPKIEVPVVLKLDDPPHADLKAPPRTPYSRRVTKCLEEAAAAGLDASARAAYSRACANR